MALSSVLRALNDILTSGMAAVIFGLLLYLWFYNRGNRLTRPLLGLLSCVLWVYLGDILITGLRDAETAIWILRAQWVGISFTPIFYLELTRALRLTMNTNHSPRWLYVLGYGFSAVVALLALLSDVLVHDGTQIADAWTLHAGRFFWPFAFYFVGASLYGLTQTLRARQRCFTGAARRRMAYFGVGFLAPALGVFPYLLMIGGARLLTPTVLYALLIVGNLGISALLVLLTYSVAFIGALTPERIIKHRLVRYLLRGPFATLVALFAYALGIKLAQLLHLSTITLPLVLAGMTWMLAQIAVELFKPVLDVALYREAHTEIARIQDLSYRLLTSADLRQFLEQILAATCELMHSKGGFLAVLDASGWRNAATCGPALAPTDLSALQDIDTLSTQVTSVADGVIWRDYRLFPIHDKTQAYLIGLLGVQAPQAHFPLEGESASLLDQLLRQAGTALEDQRLQQTVLNAFSSLLPELDAIQKRRALLRYNGSAMQDFTTLDPSAYPQWVHDALAHYWGGPRLTENPLLQLQVVQQAAQTYQGDAIKGLREVLAEAIEQLRPAGERKLTAPEWLLYNILEMKFLRGQKVREVAMRLALSEADFYRKQRVAIENLARIIAEMEAQARRGDTPEP